jgi:hypothetical protein
MSSEKQVLAPIPPLTKKKMDVWIADFCKHGIIQVACDNTKTERLVVERWLEKWQRFRSSYEMAKRMAADYLEQELRERALSGGKNGYKPSDQIAVAMLEAKKPDEFGKDAKRKQVDSVKMIVFKSDVPPPRDDQTAWLEKGKRK